MCKVCTFVFVLNKRGTDAAIAFTERIKSGVVGEQLWLQISEPTEKDKGKYAIEFFDGKGGLRRTVELAGQAFDDAFAEFQRLNFTITCVNTSDSGKYSILVKNKYGTESGDFT
ncbi:hypothetical protein cypCar_00049457, partial [Cyprinus carpio]